MTSSELTPLLYDVLREIERARAKHPPIGSLHEGYAVLLEEVDEFWDEVKKRSRDRNPENIRTELVQIAAMAMRILLDVDFSAKA